MTRTWDTAWQLAQMKWRRTERRRERRHSRACAKRMCDRHLRQPSYAELLRQNTEALERI